MQTNDGQKILGWRLSLDHAGTGDGRQGFKLTEFFLRRRDANDDQSVCADIIDPETGEPSREIAERLRDCWNLCAGMKDPSKEIAALREVFESAQRLLNADAALAKASLASEGWEVPEREWDVAMQELSMRVKAIAKAEAPPQN